MDSIKKVKSISKWIFIVPFFAVNACLIIVIFFADQLPHGIGIGPTFPYFDGGTSISRTARPYPSWLVFDRYVLVCRSLP